MQDSLNDYIRISKSSGKPVVEYNSHDILLAAQRKKNCEERALKIVEFSIEGKLRPEVFLKCLCFLNQTYYQDIVEERAIIRLCGYPLCGKKLSIIPKKQYLISTKENKVYDITERKNYCSNFCYKASLFVKNQIDASPLWMRSFEQMPQYELLEDKNSGLIGELVDQGPVKPPEDDNDTDFTSISSFTEVSLDEMIEYELNGNKSGKNKKSKPRMNPISESDESSSDDSESPSIKKKPVRRKSVNTTSKMAPIFENEEATKNIETTSKLTNSKEILDQKLKSLAQKIKDNSKVSKIKCINPVPVFNEPKINPILTPNKSDEKPKSKIDVDTEKYLISSVKSWITLETLIFIKGENKINAILSEKKLSDYFENLKIAEKERQVQQKYMDLCKKLHLREMAEEKFENLVSQNSLKSLPDFQQLKEDGKDMNVKVKSFYGGVLYEADDTNFPMKKIQENQEENSSEAPAVLPLADYHSKNAMRRKIFLNSVNKSVGQLLKDLDLDANSIEILADMQELVKTFYLNANNIVFKPLFWSYLALTLLNILAMNSKELSTSLQEKPVLEQINLILSELPNENKIVTTTLEIFQNVEHFIEEYILSVDY